jgi:hypothetical protein
MPIILPKNNWYGKPTISPHSVDAMFMNFRSAANPVTSSTIGNTLVFIYQFKISVEFPITYFWWINGATVNGNVSMGVYDQDGNLIISCGTVAQSGASSLQSAAPSATTILGPGKYWMGFATSSTTSTFTIQNNSIASSRAAGWRSHAVTAGNGVPVPSTLTFAAANSSVNPFVGITRLQVI